MKIAHAPKTGVEKSDGLITEESSEKLKKREIPQQNSGFDVQ